MPRYPPAFNSGASFFSIRSSTLIARNPADASFRVQWDLPAPDIPMNESLSKTPLQRPSKDSVPRRPRQAPRHAQLANLYRSETSPHSTQTRDRHLFSFAKFTRCIPFWREAGFGSTDL